jgi:signal transduction histidine kinase
MAANDSFHENSSMYIKISVIDTGIGIKTEDQKKLFNLFGYIKDSEQMNIHGIGLGLVISKNIVETFGGTISLSSEYGVGSNFSFTFKINEDVEAKRTSMLSK